MESTGLNLSKPPLFGLRNFMGFDFARAASSTRDGHSREHTKTCRTAVKLFCSYKLFRFISVLACIACELFRKKKQVK